MVLLLVSLFSLVLANPGLQISQDEDTFREYVQYLIQTSIPAFNLSNCPNFNFTQPLGHFRVMNVSLTNIKITNLSFGSSLSVIALVPPSGLKLLLFNFTGEISFSYLIVGQGLSVDGSATGNITSSLLLANTTLGVVSGLPHLSLTVQLMNVSTVALQPLSLPAELVQGLQVQIANITTIYLTSNGTTILQSISNQLLGSENSRFAALGNSLLMDMSWTQPAKIVANETAAYVLIYINGTVIPASGVCGTINTAPPVSMPDRIVPEIGVGGYQIFISQYVLDSYFWAFLQYQSVVVNQTVLPLNFPVSLTTGSGYFPEIAAKYGANLPITLNLTLLQAPILAIDPVYGFRTNLEVIVQLLLSTSSGWVSPITYSVVLLYFSDLYFSQGQFQGYPLRPVININWVKSAIGLVNNAYLNKFTNDFFTGAAMTSWNVYLFPAFPISITPGLGNLHFRRVSGYLTIDLDVVGGTQIEG